MIVNIYNLYSYEMSDNIAWKTLQPNTYIKYVFQNYVLYKLHVLCIN